MIISVYVDDDTAHRLALIATETGRDSEELAESAVSEAALNYFKGRNGPIPRAADDKEKGK